MCPHNSSKDEMKMADEHNAYDEGVVGKKAEKFGIYMSMKVDLCSQRTFR
jgi:hypothetical protein